MLSLYDLKPRFQAFLRPGVRWLAGRGVRANQVTLAALGLSVVWGGALAWSGGAGWALAGLPMVLLLRMALNAMDGMLAREHGQQSRAGAILNEVGDVVSDAALYLPFALILGPLWTLPVIGFLIAETSGLAPLAAGGRRHYEGPLGKSDRAAFFGGFAIVLANVTVPATVSAGLAVGLCLLSALTVANRLRGSLHA